MRRRKSGNELRIIFGILDLFFSAILLIIYFIFRVDLNKKNKTETINNEDYENDELKNEKTKDEQKNILRLEKEKERELLKRNKEIEKTKAKEKNEASKQLNSNTLLYFEIGKPSNALKELKEIKFDLSSEIKFLLDNDSSYLNQKKKITTQKMDEFLYSGKFSSVLGFEGFDIFKEMILKNIQLQIDSGKADIFFESNILKDIIFISGIYFEYEQASKIMKSFEDRYEYRTLQRLILQKEMCASVVEIELNSLKQKHPKYFNSFSDEDVKSLIIMNSAISDELSESLKVFIKNTSTIKFVA
jgi:hypothetical protein